MSERVANLIPLLAALHREERAEVLEYLHELDSRPLDEDGEEVLPPDEWEAVWADEINRRIADAAMGKTKPVPHDEVMRRLKEKYG